MSYSDSFFQTNYKIIEKIGQGSFGDVYKVYSNNDKQYFAIKKIIRQYTSAMDRDKKLREAIKHSHMPKHPNLVSFFNYWEENNSLFIRIELCSSNLQIYSSSEQKLGYHLAVNYLLDSLSVFSQV